MSTLDAVLGRPSPQHRPNPLEAPAPGRPPTARGLAGELRTVFQVPRLVRAAPWLAFAPRGHGRAVIDLPGWKAPEASNAALRAYLRFLGYASRPWGLGTNQGNPERDARKLVEQLGNDPDGPPVALVGWSLGGVVAREVARAVPERVACVVTFGSPVLGGPRHTVRGNAYSEDDLRRVEALAERLDAKRPIRVPTTAIYTRDDRVVDWRACIDRRTPGVEHVEVRSTHLGLGIDPDVWWAVAQALEAGAW